MWMPLVDGMIALRSSNPHSGTWRLPRWTKIWSRR